MKSKKKNIKFNKETIDLKELEKKDKLKLRD
jgi:hypothetical protein